MNQVNAPHHHREKHSERWHFNHILVIQTAFIGDVILTTPLLRRTKELFPDASIDVLVNPKTAELLSANPHIRDIIPYDKREKEKGLLAFLKLSRRLHRSRYDAAFLPHRSTRSALLAALAGINLRIGFDTSPGSFLYTSTIRYEPDLHETERYLLLLSPFSHDSGDPTPDMFTDHSNDQKAYDLLHKHHLDDIPIIVGMAPGSVWPTKRWIPEGFATVADKLIAEKGAGVILFGGPEDQELCTRIVSIMKNTPVVSAGDLSLRESASLIAKCHVFLSNDTGIMHLAAAMKVPVVAIFGATVPSFGFAPVGEGHTIIEKQLPCRPCGTHGGRQCVEDTFACMKDISPEEVYDAVTMYIETRSQSNSHQ